MKNILTVGLALLASAALIGCGPPPTYKVNYALEEAPEAHIPKKIVILTPDIVVSEHTLGGVSEKVEEWGRQASTNVAKSLVAQLQSRPGVRIVALPRLTRDEQQRVDQHRALYDQVAAAAFEHTMGKAGENPNVWPHKQNHFDYTLGNGLRFLKAKTGADAAIFAVGADQVSTGGRKAAHALGALVGIHVDLGYSFLTIGFVDLNTGDVLWFDYDFYGNGDEDMRDAGDVNDIVQAILKNYPGVEMKNHTVARR